MFCVSFLKLLKIGAVGFDCSIHWLPNESNLKHTLDVRQTNNMKQRTRYLKYKNENQEIQADEIIESILGRASGIFPPLSLFLIATVADPCKKPNENTLLKGRPAKSGRVKKAPQA